VEISAGMRRTITEERAEATLEYILVVGIFIVALGAALLLGVQAIVPGVLRALCSTVDPVGFGAGGPCPW
jgi:hypothetical protein